MIVWENVGLVGENVDFVREDSSGLRKNVRFAGEAVVGIADME